MKAEDRTAILEKLASAELKHAEARVKALRARRAADKAEREESAARAAHDKIWNEYFAQQDDAS